MRTRVQQAPGTSAVLMKIKQQTSGTSAVLVKAVQQTPGTSAVLMKVVQQLPLPCSRTTLSACSQCDAVDVVPDELTSALCLREY